MSAKINGVNLPSIAEAIPIQPPHSQILSRACDRFLMSRGLPVRRKFGLAAGKLKEPDLTDSKERANARRRGAAVRTNLFLRKFGH
jgi:hypothetical protein